MLIFRFHAGDVKPSWRRSVLKHNHRVGNNQQNNTDNLIGNSLINYDAQQRSQSTMDDNASQLSYGSHLNRDFDCGSHRGSFPRLSNEADNEEQQKKLSSMLLGSYDDVDTEEGDQRPKRSVVIDEVDVDMYSTDEIDERVAQAKLEAEILEATTQELLMKEYPSDCCPESCYLRFPFLRGGDPDSPFWQGWGNLRIKTFRLIENKYFETAVIAMILISSLALVSPLAKQCEESTCICLKTNFFSLIS